MAGLVALGLGSALACGRGVSRDPVRHTGTGGASANVQGGDAGLASSESGSGGSAGSLAIAGEGGEDNSPIDNAAGDSGAPPLMAGASGMAPIGIGGGRGGADTSGGSGGATNGGSGGCSGDTPFATAQRVGGLAAGSGRLRFGSDENTGYYARQHLSSYDLLTAVRGTLDASFGMHRVVLSTGDWDFSPAVSSDGSTIYFERYVNERWWIYQGTWDAAETKFSSVMPVPGLGLGDSGPFLTRDGNTLYFHRLVSGSSTIATAERQSQGFSNVTILQFAGLGAQSFPVLSADELSLYFAVSNGATLGATPNPDADIWKATRLSKQEKFSAPVKLTELSTTDNEIPSFLSDDGCRLYFDRNSSDPFDWGTSDQVVWVAQRKPPN